MDKQEEINEVKRLAEKLGENSYLGPWLLQVLPELERDLRSDFIPTLTLVDAKAKAESIIDGAEIEAKQMLKNAQSEIEGQRERLEEDKRRFDRAQNEFCSALRVCERRIQDI